MRSVGCRPEGCKTHRMKPGSWLAHDPRRVRGRRYRLGSVLALCLLAVLGGATTLAGIARFAIDSTPEVRKRIGLDRPPRATTLGRLLSRIDGDALDDAVSAWLARHSRDPSKPIRPSWWE